MKAVLSVTWELSTEHQASTYGQPVLVNRATGDADGPSDVVQVYGPMGRMVAAKAVYRLCPGSGAERGGAGAGGAVRRGPAHLKRYASASAGTDPGGGR